MIEYRGPRQMRRNIEEFVQDNIFPSLARNGTIPFYVGRLLGVSMKPQPHFLFDDAENKRVEEAFERYGKAQVDEKEKVYQEVRPICLAASPLPENVTGGYQRDTDSVAFSPHRLLDYLHISIPEGLDVERLPIDEWKYYMNAHDFPHAIAHELVHWDIAETKAYTEIRKAFAGWEEAAEDPRLIAGKMHDIVKDGIERNDSRALYYSALWSRLWECNIYHFNEVIAECVGFALVPSPTGRIYPPPETSDAVVDCIHNKIQIAGIKETLAFAKQLMDDAYERRVNVYDLLGRA